MVVSAQVLMHIYLIFRKGVFMNLKHMDSGGWSTSSSDLIDSTPDLPKLGFQVYIAKSCFLCEFKGFELRAPACMTDTVMTELCPQPILDFLYQVWSTDLLKMKLLFDKISHAAHNSLIIIIYFYLSNVHGFYPG